MPPLLVTADPCPWMKIAEAERKQKVVEIAGKLCHPRIALYHASVGLAPNDEVSWCSSFVNWCVEEAGEVGTNLPNARSWLEWGVPLEKPRRGCIVVLWRNDPKSWEGHVGFYEKHTAGGEMVQLLGGNQGNRVCSAPYADQRVLGYRWPAP